MTGRALAFTVLAAAALCLGVLAIVKPYTRGIVGDQDGSRMFVETACAAPIVAVGSDGTRAVDAAGNWVTEPPCQRSAGYRLALGAILLVCAGGAAYGAVKQSRRTADAAW
jgi:hypothetical protein